MGDSDDDGKGSRWSRGCFGFAMMLAVTAAAVLALLI
jgi:hypothetical protein